MRKPLGAVLALSFSLSLSLLAAPARADITALVVSEPTSRKDGLMVSRQALEAQLARAAGQDVKVVLSEDLSDAMRATRSRGFDVFVAPAQVVASALAHGYELVGATDGEEQYVLVGQPSLTSAAELRKSRIYLPQQDSIYTYLARGMLTSAGLSFKDLRQVEYARYPQAGLTAVGMKLSEATVVRRTDWESWARENPGAARMLASTGGVPGGFSVALSKDLPADLRGRLAKWFQTAAGSAGLRPVAVQPELLRYQRVAELGSFTPTALPGATVVTAEQVAQLIAQGAVIVDTRNEQEFKARHIPGALFVPYVEKSLKDVAYDPAQDDFAGLARLDPARPTVFHCNGAECWKSYKAARAALGKGFRKVYWFRGGMPEWQKAGQQLAQQ